MSALSDSDYFKFNKIPQAPGCSQALETIKTKSKESKHVKNGVSKDLTLPILPSDKMCSPSSVRQVSQSSEKDREALPVIFNNNGTGRIKRKKDNNEDY